MRKIIALALILSSFVFAEDDKKWVWGDNNRNAQGQPRFQAADRDFSPRYEIFENEEPIAHQRPFLEKPSRPLFQPVERPGGVYGGNARPGSYGEGSSYPEQAPGILTGPIPSWVREGPHKEFDKCKCTQKFNCNSPGISYGHCDVGKQYCCYSTKKIDQIGGPAPSRPVYSEHNGVLVGPGGGHPHSPHRPGGPGGFGVGGRPGNYGNHGPVRRPSHGAENGILVGPGGPFDRPGAGLGYGGGYARSAKS